MSSPEFLFIEIIYMSETFEKVLVKDDRLGCITSKVKFQVFRGGQNVTCQPFKAISATNASHVYNVTVPSLNYYKQGSALEVNSNT